MTFDKSESYATIAVGYYDEDDIPDFLVKYQYGSGFPVYEYEQVSSIYLFSTYVWFISYSKCSNWHWISKLASNFGCLFTFCYLDGANSIKTDFQFSLQ